MHRCQRHPYRQALRRARVAVLLIFFVNGAASGNWVTRIPQIKRELGLDEGALGVALLAMSGGLLASQLLMGGLAARLGSSPITRLAVIASCGTLVLPGLAPSPLALTGALAVLGASLGALDVAMNAQGVTVERRHGWPLLSSFHAAYSFGGLVGAVTGGLAAASAIDVGAHLFGAGVALGTLGLIAWRSLLPAHADAATGAPGLARPSWRVAGLGVIGFCALLGEGAVANWSAVYLSGPLQADDGLAAGGYAAFSVAMVIGRLLGDRLSAAWGPVRLTRFGGALAAVGLGSSLLIAHPLVAIGGFACLGAGLASVFPVVISAAGRSTGQASAPAIAAVSTIGYIGLLAGPPAIGLTAELVSLPVALGLIVALATVIALMAHNVSKGEARRDSSSCARSQ
jgi:predicted MFS family arabinose efflux permease